MHTEPMPESAGAFSAPVPSAAKCPNCKQLGKVTFQTWKSHCGGYEDNKFTCTCGHSWWVDGPDA